MVRDVWGSSLTKVPYLTCHKGPSRPFLRAVVKTSDREVFFGAVGQSVPKGGNFGLWLRAFLPWIGTSPSTLNQHTKDLLRRSLNVPLR